MLDFTRKQVFVAILALMGVAFWLRFYQHHEWLIFKWDQARDALLLSKAIEEGPGYLPLLGPRATKVGTDYLRLGPAYYYLMVFSGWLFNSTAPEVFSYPDLFFSILVLPLFYLFLRLYFNRFHSFLGVLLYAFSFLIIQYSRFSWNPNSVPFFVLLTFYALLRFLRTKKTKAKLVWLGILTGAAVIAGQLHFFAFFSLTGILGVYLLVILALWKKESWKKTFSWLKTSFFWKALGIILIITAIFYSPMIVSEIKTGGSNSKNFLGAFSEKPKDKPLGKKIIRNFREQGNYYFLLMTSFYHRPGKKADPISVGFAWTFLMSSLFLTVWKIKKERDEQRKNFLKLLLVWAGVFFLVTVPMAYQLRPRFFVVVFALPFIFSVLWLDFFREKLGEKKSMRLVGVVVFLALASNFYGVYRWFEQNRLSETTVATTGRHFILKKDDGINLGQLERAVDYVLEKNPGQEINYYAKPEYEAPVEYLIQQRDSSRPVEFVKETEKLRGKANLWAFNTTKGGWESVSQKIKDYTQVLEKRQFGQLTVFYLKVDQEKLVGFLETREQEQKKGGSEIGNEKINNTNEDEENEEEIDEAEKKTERLFWKDLWNKESNQFKEEIRFKE